MLSWFESYWWIVLIGAVLAPLIDDWRRKRRERAERPRRDKLSEEERAEEDRIKLQAYAEALTEVKQARAESKEAWRKLYGVLWLAAVCAGGLWAVGKFLPDLSESRAFMACALTLLWLIFRRLEALEESRGMTLQRDGGAREVVGFIFLQPVGA